MLLAADPVDARSQGSVWVEMEPTHIRLAPGAHQTIDVHVRGALACPLRFPPQDAVVLHATSSGAVEGTRTLWHIDEDELRFEWQLLSASGPSGTYGIDEVRQVTVLAETAPTHNRTEYTEWRGADTYLDGNCDPSGWGWEVNGTDALSIRLPGKPIILPYGGPWEPQLDVVPVAPAALAVTGGAAVALAGFVVGRRDP